MAWLSRFRQAAKPSLLGAASSRTYSATAALQLDYDTEEEVAEELGEGWVPGRGVQWVVMGDSGQKIKRHVYAEKLSKLLEVPLISMGSLLRQELHPRSSLYGKISNAINEGKLVPEDVIFGLLSKRLEEGYERGESGFILDGIPRTRIQAEILDEVADIDLVVNMKCPEEHLVRRDSIGLVNSSSCFTDSGVWKEKILVHSEQQLWELCKEKYELLWVKGGNHCDLEHYPEYIKHLKKFISIVEKSPSRRYRSRKSTDQFKPSQEHDSHS